MLIMIYSSRFYPSIGGMETVAMQLARAFVELGHEAIVITTTAAKDDQADRDFPFKIIRNPSFALKFKWARRADIILHNAIGLKALLPDIFFGRKFFVMHQTWYSKGNLKKTILATLKLAVCSFAKNVYISSAIRDHISKKGVIIPNPYDDSIFKRLPEIAKSNDLVFLGRLVSDKGCSLLLQALHRLNIKGNRLSLTIVGEGPEKEYLQYLCGDLRLNDQVTFLGKMEGKELATELNRHKIMVVPSLWEEPFGIVALEGWACGCFVVGSEKGGLKDAVGPCGLTFANGSIEGLVQSLETALNAIKIPETGSCVSSHLQKFTSRQIAGQYLHFFKQSKL